MLRRRRPDLRACLRRSLCFARSPAALCALGGVAAASLVLGLLAAFGTGEFWGPPGRSAFCEGADARGWVRQRANSWSNLSYVAAGCWALGRAAEGRLRRASVSRAVRSEQPSPAVAARLPCALSVAMGLSSVALGLGSFLFHASLTRFWQQADVAAMYWAMNAALAVTCWRWLFICRPTAPLYGPRVLLPLLGLVAVADGVMFALKWKLSATVVFSAQVGTVIVSELLCSCASPPAARRRTLPIAAVAIAAGLSGFLFQRLGIHHKKRGTGGGFCAEWSAWQPHALWHVLTGIALLLLHEIQIGPTLEDAGAPPGGQPGPAGGAREESASTTVGKSDA
mmetsp:Transcript_99846/g.311029  ORF Transcript_99846/g.311029 Transcript_99846/m.311029 type:complete len:339 (+) Transcript_99846:87-1103(+)